MTSYEVVNKIAVITCQNPPVNALSYNLRKGLIEGVGAAVKDDNVVAIVICADGKTFIAGADIKEFGTPKVYQMPLNKFIDQCEASPKPVVAAIHGTALGGGFEVALTCHYRIGTSRCKVGLPEVLIGLLPGAGGTQRLPRLIGPLLASEMICSGKHLPGQTAYERGILDEIVNIEPNHGLSSERLILRTAAIRFALKIADRPVGPRVISRRTCPTMDDMFYEMTSAQLSKRARGFLAPQLCLQAVRAAQDNSTDFKKGMKKERDLFMKLIAGPQARSLQHIFFGQRQITKIPGIDVKRESVDIKRVGIIGCGTMGGGILMCFVEQGVPVTVLESKQEYLDRGLKVLQGNWMRQVKKGRLSKKKYEKYLSMIRPTLNYADLSDVDVVVEAVFENLEIKRKVFKQLDVHTKPDCILASNTSFLPIEKIAEVVKDPSRVIGCHFFAPANKMQLLENVRHDRCSNRAITTATKMAKLIKKKGVLVQSCMGFVGNRMYAMEAAEAARLLLEGCLPAQLDAVCYKDIGCAMGIMQVGDLSGLDIGYKSRHDASNAGKKSLRSGYKEDTSAISDRLVESGRIGLKVGKGYYDYPGLPKSRKQASSKLVEQIILEESKRQGVVRRNIDNKEIIERLFYPLINEGFKVLEEGIAIRPSDIDVVFVFGYGFPAFRGGPMFWAENEIGLKKLLKSLRKYHEMHPNVPYFKPSQLLVKCVESKMSLSKYWKKKMKAKQAKL